MTGTFDDRGEMGGKRRKLPHERAGWKEMDEEPKPKKRRGGRRSNSVNGNGVTANNGFGVDVLHHSPVGGMSAMGLDAGSLGEAAMHDNQILQSHEQAQQGQSAQQDQIPPPADS